MAQIRRILFPTDFSERAHAAWAYAELLATKFGAEVHLLHVLQEPVAVLPESSLAVAPPAVNLPDLIEAAEEGLARVAVAAPASIAGRTVLHGPTAEEVVRYATEVNADLIVMGTHGRTGLAHVLLGSVAERVVRKAPCAVLTVRSQVHDA